MLESFRRETTRLTSDIMSSRCPLVVVFICLLSLGRVGAETGIQAWVQRYGNAADSADQGRKVVTDNVGNVIVVWKV
jgi:hypothetical protein